MAHSERAHARFSASSAYRWFACPGSARMLQSAPARLPNPHAELGTLAHEVLEGALRSGIWQLPPDHMHAGKAVDPEMRAAVNTCLNYVQDLCDMDENAVLLFEERFDLPTHIQPDETYGYNDILVWLPMFGQMHVIDYKNGAEIVDVEENKQLLYYGTGALSRFKDWDVRSVFLTIVQPRAFHAQGPIRSYEVSPERLRAFLHEVDDAVLACLDPDAPLVPGKKQCRWCDAFTICPAAEAAALNVASNEFADIRLVGADTMPDPKTLGLDRLAYIVQAAPYLKAWLDACEARAFGFAMMGHPIPGKKVVRKLSRRQYDGDPAEIAEGLTLIADVTLDEVMPRKLLGITDMEALLVARAKDKAPRGKKKEAAEQAKHSLAFFTIKEPNDELTLVDLSDRRDAVNPIAKSLDGISLPELPMLPAHSTEST